MRDIAVGLLTALLGGSLWAGVASLRQSKSLARKTNAEAEALEAEAPAKLDSVVVQGAEAAVLTMQHSLAAETARADRAEAENATLRAERTEHLRVIDQLRQEVADLRTQVEQKATSIERRLDEMAHRHDDESSPA